MQVSEAEKIWPLLFHAGSFSNFSDEEKDLFCTAKSDQEMALALGDPEHVSILMDHASIASKLMDDYLSTGVVVGELKDLIEQTKRQADIVYSALRLYRVAPAGEDKLRGAVHRINAEWTKFIDDIGLVNWIEFRWNKYGSKVNSSSNAKGKNISDTMEQVYDSMHKPDSKKR